MIVRLIVRKMSYRDSFFGGTLSEWNAVIGEVASCTLNGVAGTNILSRNFEFTSKSPTTVSSHVVECRVLQQRCICS